MITKFQKNYMNCSSGCLEGDKLYVVDRFFGTLMEYDIGTYTYKIMVQLNFFDVRMQYRARKIIKIADTFYFFFENSNSVYTWSLGTKLFEKYGNEKECNIGHVIVSEAFLIKEKIWIIPGWSDQPLQYFCVNTKEVHEYMSVGKQLEKFGIVLEQDQEIVASVDKRNTIWFAVCDKPYIIFYNTESDEWGIHTFNEEDHISGIRCDENDTWICFTDKSSFISWDFENGIVAAYEIPDEQLNMEEKDPYHFICSYKNNIFVIPYFDNDIFIVNRQSKEVFSMGFLSQYNSTEVRLRPPAPLFFGFVRIDKKLIILPYSIDVIVVIDMETGQLRCIGSRKKQEECDNYLKKVYKQNVSEERVIWEGHKCFWLEDYLSYVMVADSDEYRLEQLNICGKQIFNKVRSL